MNYKCKLNKITDNFIKDYLTACGVTNVEKYLHPNNSCYENPMLYHNMDIALDVFHNKIIDKNVGIVKDSDMDGDCSAAIIYQFCKNICGVTPTVYVHNNKQHGVHDLIEQILKGNHTLLIVPDAGTNDTSDFMVIKQNNPSCEILVLDHHTPLMDNPYATIVNNQIGNVNKHLSGTGVTYKFIEAYCNKFNIEVPNYKDLVGLSIVSDVCSFIPLENRAFLNECFTNPQNKFIKMLFQTLCTKRGVCPAAIGWDISPLSNALARMEEQEYKNFFFECLVGERNDYEEAIKEMKRIKRKQDTMVKNMVDDIEIGLDNTHKSLIEFTDAENKGLIGLCAMKLSGKYNKPTIILRPLNSTMWTGSLRSPVELLDEINKSNLAQCMGHGAACGITVKKSNLSKLRTFLDGIELTQNIDYDICADISTKDITLKLCEDIKNYNVLWGNNIAKPLFYTRLQCPEVYVYRKTTTTLKLVQDGISFMKFFCDDDTIKQFENKQNLIVDIIFELDINEYNGVASPQANIVKYEIQEEQNESNNEQFNWDEIFR